MPNTVTGDHYLKEGNALVAEGRYGEARDAYYRALQLGDATPGVLLTLGGCCAESGHIEEAVVHTRASLALAPRDPRAHVQLGILCLLLGHAEPGWTALAQRRNLIPSPMPPGPPIPEWRGEPLEGRGILLLHEQGLGDVIHTARYVRRIQERGGVAYLDVQDALKRLLVPQFPPGTVLQPGQSARISTFAYILDLPRLMGDPPQGPPGEAPYLALPDDAPRPELPAVPRGTKRVGIAWAGAAIHPRDLRRSMKLELLRPLLETPGFQFVSLLDAMRAPAIAQAGLEARVVDMAPRMRDLFDVAAIIREMDLVLTVDTAVAHLAGALGKPVWMLVCNPPDWRWGRHGETTAWYPTMRIFRQERPDDWAPVLARVTAELLELSRVR